MLGMQLDLEFWSFFATERRRETRLLGILSFVHSTVWKVLFGKVADSLEKGTEREDEYMISEKELLVNRFISIPKDMGTFNCGAFVAGIVKGVLDNAGFPAVVTAHFVPIEGQQRPRTTILIKFADEVSISTSLYMIYLYLEKLNLSPGLPTSIHAAQVLKREARLSQ
ncbi:hypothetical protein F2Q69_00001058 [Brassica cretica]|uniref:Trafficking protein particle complex subunit n=1 Tax=Brassica cretica TaxID=69181 RepID=A0A8S9PIK3_BRACR|nr:hypothetical protein F2Q69_00001058 [Brassica cretica]